MKKLICQIICIILMTMSVVYQIYSVDRQLFHIHNIQRGSLKLGQQLNQYLSKQQKIFNEQHGFGIYAMFDEQKNKIRQFILKYKNTSIIETESQNFLAIFKSNGHIDSKGDSFYHISDKIKISCTNQIIQNVQSKHQHLIIKGYFADCDNSSYQIKISPIQQSIIINAQVFNKQYNRISIYCQHSSSSSYFGLGEQFSHLNLGHNRPYSLFIRQKGVGRTDQPETFLINLFYGAGGSYYHSYSPAPIWYSLDKKTKDNDYFAKSYFLQSWAYCIWMNNQIYVWDSKIKLVIQVSNSIKKLVSNIASINGWTGPPPQWVSQGAIVGLQGGTESVLKKYDVLHKSGSKIVGVWIQDWVNKRKSLGFSRLWWNWELDENHYHDWNQFKNKLDQNNVSILIYINPMLTNVEGLKEKYNNNYYKKAIQQKYFVNVNKQQKLFETTAFTDWKASLLNLSQNLKARIFYQNMITSALNKTGARGLMVDFGEAFPVQNNKFTLQQSIKSHNRYPTQYQKVVREVLDKVSSQIYSFSRAGYIYTPKYTKSLWAGDQSMNFRKNSGLRSCLIAMLSSSLIGYSSTHCDIGGYSSYKILFHKTSVRTQVLMTRWMQLSAFSAVFRTHEGNLPDQSLQVYSNQQISVQFAFYSHIYAALSSYRKSQFVQQQMGKTLNLSLVRPMFIQNSQNHDVYQIQDQYYLGKYILVNPILSQKSNRKYYLPKGKWVNIWNRVEVEGCDCFVQSFSYLPAVLIKSQYSQKQSILDKISKVVNKFKIRIKYLSEIENNQKQLGQL